MNGMRGWISVILLVLASQIIVTHNWSVQPVRAADSPLIVFDEALAAGWQDFSYGGTANFTNSSPVFAGTKSIAFTPSQAFGGLSLRAPQPIATTGYRAIAFRFFSPTGSERYEFYTQASDDGPSSAAYTFGTRLITAPGGGTTGEWRNVVVPLSLLGNPAEIKRISIQQDEGGLGTIYVDDILLLPTAPGIPDTTADGSRSVNGPSGVAIAPNGRIYLAVYPESRVLSWPNRAALVGTAAPDLIFGVDGVNANGDPDNSGCAFAPSARILCGPESVAVDSGGNLYVADTYNHRVLIFFNPESDGTPTTADVVLGQSTFTGGAPDVDLFPGNNTREGLHFPRGVAVDFADNLYVVDVFNQRILRYDWPLWGSVNLDEMRTPDLVLGKPDLNTLGTGTSDAGPLQTGLDVFRFPLGVAVDSRGNVYVTDFANNRVQRFDAPLTNGKPAAQSYLGFFNPHDVAIDGNGNLYVADTKAGKVKLFQNPLVDSTVDLEFAPPFAFPMGVAVDAAGTLYVADCGRAADNNIDTFPPCRRTPRGIVIFDAQTGSGPTPTPTSQPGPAPILSSIRPISGTTNSLTFLTITGLNFRAGAKVAIQKQAVTQDLLNVTVSGATTILAEAPAGLSTGVYDVVVTNSDGTTGRLKAAFTIFGQAPIPVSMVPIRGDKLVPNDLRIDGFNFRDGLVVEMQKDGIGPFQPLASVDRLNATRVTAVVPIALPSGVYDLVLRNAGVQEVGRIARAYTVFAAGEDDLMVGEEDLWTDPPTVRQGSTVQVGINIHRPFGTAPIQVPVRLFLGNPDSGGQLIGEATSSTLAAPNDTISVTVPWAVGNRQGAVDLYAVVDPAGTIAEIAKTNNRTSRTFTILPASAAPPPRITSMTIAGGSQATSNPLVGIQFDAAPGSSDAPLGYVLVNEREYNSAARDWVAVASTGWIQYSSLVTVGLTERSGSRFFEAYVADSLGTISLQPARSQIDYTPSTDDLLQGQRRVYRRGVKPGDVIAFTVDATSGDPDVNLFGPANNLVLGRNQIGNGREEAVYTVATGGVYQIEISAATDTVFGFNIRSGAPTVALAAGGPSIAADDRPAPLKPIVPVSGGPATRFGLPQLPIASSASGKIVNVPAVVRGYQAGW